MHRRYVANAVQRGDRLLEEASLPLPYINDDPAQTYNEYANWIITSTRPVDATSLHTVLLLVQVRWVVPWRR